MSKTINGITIPDQTVFEHLCERNKSNLNIPALEYFGNQLTYKEFFEEIHKYAAAFRAYGIKKGDVVTLCMPGVPEFVIAWYALNSIGAIANGVSIAFLKNNLKKYTDEKNSSTLILFDQYYSAIKEQVPLTNIKNIITTNLFDYMPKEVKYKMESLYPKAEVEHIIGKNYIPMHTFIETGARSFYKEDDEKYDENRDSTFLYTSGTTGDPKCIVFRDDAINALPNMHDHCHIEQEQIGDRSLLIIPPYYATSLLYAIHLQLCKGKTLVFQPNYNKNTYAKDLLDLNINHNVAAVSHQSTLIHADLPKNSLKNFTMPISGGEGVPLGLCKQINKALEDAGANRLMVGGGTSELGSGIMCAYNLEGRTNETGILFPGAEVKIIDPITKEIVPDGTRGEMIVSSPNLMNRYYNNEQATNDYFTIDENGKKWGWPRDIAIHNANGSYTMLGRKSDSFVTPDKKIVYLFDYEEKISEEPGVLEVEAVALPTNNNDHIKVLHVVVSKDYIGKESEVIENICKNHDIQGIKIIDSFGTSPITGKRNIKILQDDRTDFYLPNDDETLKKVSYPISGNPIVEIVNKTEVNTKIKKLELK